MFTLMFAPGLVILWGITYIFGSIAFLFLSPKICKGILNGTSVVGTVLGGMLSAVAGTAMAVANPQSMIGKVGQSLAASMGGKLPGMGGQDGAASAAGGGSGGGASAASKSKGSLADVATAVLGGGQNKSGGAVSGALGPFGMGGPPGEGGAAPSIGPPSGGPGGLVAAFGKAASMAAGMPGMNALGAGASIASMVGGVATHPLVHAAASVAGASPIGIGASVVGHASHSAHKHPAKVA